MTHTLSKLSRRSLLAITAIAWALPSFAQDARWADIEKKAQGQTVYFNAWAGSERINAYLQWAGSEVQRLYGVKLEHVKVTDTVDVVKRVRSEKQAGKTADGSVDLVWINGENFLSMKKEGLLFGPFAESLPNFKFVDTAGKPTTRLDFSEPTEGMEAPWGMAQLTFFADSAKVPNPPQNMAALLDYAKANPGRVTYPKPPNFHGTTFLKQAVLEVNADRKALYQAVNPQSFAATTEPLWRYLDALHPHLWRNGKQFPANSAAQRQMMADGELHLAITFNPNEAANEIAASRLAKSVKSYQFGSGTIGNTHFLAIAFNAKAKEGAQVLANFLMSPEAQARKADIKQWGDPTVLALDKLPAAQRNLFSAADALGLVEKPGPVLPEPHASWVDAIEKEWQRRYGQ
jgi:putative thiamine transport system substrate-binding protein